MVGFVRRSIMARDVPTCPRETGRPCCLASFNDGMGLRVGVCVGSDSMATGFDACVERC